MPSRGSPASLIVAVGAGWLIGPRVSGSFPADVWTAVAYALAGAVAYLLVGTAVSVWSGPAIDGDRFPGTAGRVAGQLAYGLLYSPLLVGLLTPFGFGWVVAVRALRRITGIPAPIPRPRVAGRHRAGAGIDPHRMGLFAALLIVAFGLFVAVLPLLIYHEPRAPWWIYRPVALFVLFSVPAWIAVIGTIRRSPSLLVTAGVICVAQAYVSFSLVTIGFVVPAILLIVARRRPAAPGRTRAARAPRAASRVRRLGRRDRPDPRRLGRDVGHDRGGVLDLHRQPGRITQLRAGARHGHHDRAARSHGQRLRRRHAHRGGHGRGRRPRHRRRDDRRGLHRSRRTVVVPA